MSSAVVEIMAIPVAPICFAKMRVNFARPMIQIQTMACVVPNHMERSMTPLDKSLQLPKSLDIGKDETKLSLFGILDVHPTIIIMKMMLSLVPAAKSLSMAKNVKVVY